MSGHWVAFIQSWAILIFLKSLFHIFPNSCHCSLLSNSPNSGAIGSCSVFALQLLSSLFLCTGFMCPPSSDITHPDITAEIQKEGCLPAHLAHSRGDWYQKWRVPTQKHRHIAQNASQKKKKKKKEVTTAFQAADLHEGQISCTLTKCRLS